MTRERDLEYAVLDVRIADGPGVLADIAAMVDHHQLKIIESTATALGGHAIIGIHIAGSPQQLDQFGKDVKLEFGPRAILVRQAEPSTPALSCGSEWRLTVVSRDYAGLLAIVTRFLLDQGMQLIVHTGEQHGRPRVTTLDCVQKFTMVAPDDFNKAVFEAELCAFTSKYGLHATLDRIVSDWR